MTDDELAVIRQRLSYSKGRVKVIEVACGRVVAKQQRVARSAWRARSFNLLPRAFGLSLLQAVPDEGGARAQAIEIARLRGLLAAGVRVPEVLHVDDRFFVMGFVDGTALPYRIEQGDAEAAFDAWQSGLAALVDVHGKGHCLSHAFARNFIATADGIALIDFEDDPLEVMSLADAQARDWLAYLHSTVWLLDVARDRVREAIARHLAGEAREVQQCVRAASRRLALLRFLPSSRRAFGREVVGAQAMGSVFPVPATA